MNTPRQWLSAVVAVALAVAGCAMPSPEPPPPVVAPPPPPAPIPELPPEPVRPAPPNPAMLRGMNGAALTALLGPPNLLRREPPAEAWRYAGAHCQLHLFLYPGGRDGQYRVAYFEILDRNAAPAPAAECLAALTAAWAGN